MCSFLGKKNILTGGDGRFREGPCGGAGRLKEGPFDDAGRLREGRGGGTGIGTPFKIFNKKINTQVIELTIG